jgi:glycosyl hydrolase family 26
MTLPPPQPAAPRRGRHADRAPARLLGITRITQTSDLPPGINALASADGKTIIVRSGLDKVSRRRAVREVLAATHRFPGLVLWPVLLDMRIRRMLAEAADRLSGLVQHLVGFVTPDSPVVALVTSAVVVAAGAGVGVGVATGVIPTSPFRAVPSGTPAAGASPRPIYKHLAKLPDSYLGVYEPSGPRSYEPVLTFAQTIGRHVNLALYYSGWGEPFQTAFAEDALGNQATPVIQINPDKPTSIAGIAAGEYDPYLVNFAKAVHAYGQNVVIGFGHEMNADWYPWGNGKVKPATFVAAWQHIVSVFRAQGDYNVTWLWTINVDTPGMTSQISDWYPGKNYVTWVGIDGYYNAPTDTFSSVFRQTIDQVEDLTGLPILISETAADAREAPEAQQITGLFHGIQRRQILGFIWFDAEGKDGQNWQLEGNGPAITAFRQAANGYR